MSGSDDPKIIGAGLPTSWDSWCILLLTDHMCP
jgi:hypothetical protein